MNKNIKKFIVMITGAVMVLSLSTLNSCEKDDDSEYVSCGSMTCSSTEPYSNEYASGCYTTQSDCENATGHSCKNCD